ncbi:hypothetical protein [Streptomyces uncialis]|uniref:hypothetical protein n=1 Tax=Streptomyces uncialis TaxID=1048205 RepID=UPI000A55B09A|nr:hypothetical protein [Streptomyces uncialis]
MRHGGPRAVAGLPVAATALLLLCAPPAHTDSREDDVHTVHCLADDRRAEVVSAAVLLGTATAVRGEPGQLRAGPGHGRELTVDQWAERHRPDFRRVCRAVMTASGDAPDKGGGESPGALTNGLLLAGVAAAFTVLGSGVERGSAHRRQRADTLSGATHAYSYAAALYLADWETGATTPYDELGRARAELATALRGVRDGGSRRRRAVALAESLPLPDELPTQVRAGAGGFVRRTARDMGEEAVRQRRSLADAVARVEQLHASFLGWQARRAGRAATRAWSRVGVSRSRRGNLTGEEDGR